MSNLIMTYNSGRSHCTGRGGGGGGVALKNIWCECSLKTSQ